MGGSVGVVWYQGAQEDGEEDYKDERSRAAKEVAW